MMGDDAEHRLAMFLGRFTPEIEAIGQAMFDGLRARLPFADALIFDNYNFLGVGFTSNGKSSGVFVSAVLYPRWANLFFFKGAVMDDPAGLLAGDGSIIRHVRMARLEDFDDERIEPLIEQAIELCEPPVDRAHAGRLIVHTVAARQRPRRPATP